ncbi:UPF0158 family protein [Pedobacter zeae]|uniref:Uncharacterized protein n=1 Tax=Pedobacter zeae TaxID=1737356 RepID=A0A7W6KH09_9SPHI|nr:UPF0158 family protein [Pedobacter zeae]MBB4110450.1 hypothetical protein [Pedobacter zeae]GGH17966.1 hypothetical protein GCM10007422_41850 [Pedobacter zeae]
MTALTSEQIKEIAETIDCGLVCHWNIKNNRLIFLPTDELMQYNDSDAWDEDIKEVEQNFNDYKEIEKPDSTDSFRFMEDFTNELPNNTRIKVTLLEALNKRKPFREFKYEIDNSGEYRQLWFDFKNRKMIEHVKDRINYIIKRETD